MTYGPCGGVAADGTCELGDRPCSYLDQPVAAWAGSSASTDERGGQLDPLLALVGRRPIVVVDLPEAPHDADSVRRAAGALVEVADAALFGDVGWARVQFPPSYRAALVAAEGLRPWAGLNCRDRNRVALEGELLALADLGAAVHCVTGDHTALGDRPDAQPVFDLDSTELAAVARRLGLLVSVGENPVAPPLDLRPARAVEKARAGAQVCFVNHAGSAERVRAFVDAARAAGPPELVFLACVPMVASRAGLELIQTFTGLALPDGFLAAIDDAADPFTTGVEQALRYARTVLEVPSVAGVDLSAAVPPGGEADVLAAELVVARELAAA
jgi:5,10-methylenetetrahydrofolate reductase